MKLVLLACLILLFNNAFAFKETLRLLRYNPPPPTEVLRSNDISEAYFVQKLDHFDVNNNKIWTQKYNTNSKFYNKSSSNVVFLMLEGEGAASLSWMSYGSWVASAKKYGALMFKLEHRFYGDSQPLSKLTTENLRYLSSRQAIADAAHFIEGMNSLYKLPSDVKWIVFGGSYSASLATWLRLKYPHLVHGAVAASGPLLAKVDFNEYYQVVIDDYAGNSEECVANLKAAMKQVDDSISNPNKDESLTTIFNLCEPIEKFDRDDSNVQNFYLTLATPFASLAQYSGQLGYTIDDMCTILANETKGKEIYRLADITKMMYSGCLDYNYKDEVRYLKDTGSKDADRQWVYQTCFEFGWYQTTDRKDKVFGNGVSVSFFTSLCADVFGPEFNETFVNGQIDQTNDYYGGLDIDVTNVAHVHGSLDPWHAVGLKKTINPDSSVIYIEGTSHCAVMYEWSEGEAPQLTAAREEVDRLIGVWLSTKN